MHPPCFNASAAGPEGPGTYAACRIESFQAAVTGMVEQGIKSVGVSNWQQRELQQVSRQRGAVSEWVYICYKQAKLLVRLYTLPPGRSLMPLAVGRLP